MSEVVLTDSERVRDGLADMVSAALGESPGAYDLFTYCDLPTGLFVLECAKRAADRDDWFPRGKWATIQSMQERVERELCKLFPREAER